MAVPVYERQKALSPLPGVCVNAPGADAYGGDVAGAFSRLTERGLRMAEDIEDAHTLEMVNAFKRDVSHYHYDPDKGALSRAGKDAIGLYSDSMTWMENKAEEYARKARSPRAVQNFRRMAGGAIVSQSEQNSIYEAKQIRAYREAEADSAIKTALDDATRNWQDDAAAESAFETAMQALELKTRGWGNEAKKTAVAEMESSFAAGRLSAMIQADPAAAEAWYKENKEKFTGATQLKAEALLKEETKAYKLEVVRDGLMKRHGMNYAAARKEVMEKYRGDEERQVWSLYEAAYSDQKRIQAEAEKRVDDNFLQKLQSFGTEAEAMNYLLKNAKSMGRWQQGKSYINWLFNGRKETKEGALLQFENDLDKGKFDALTPAQAEEKLGPDFSMTDWKEIVKPALKERQAENKSHKQIVNAIIGNEISKQRQINQNRFNSGAAELIERQYRQFWKDNPNATAEEALGFYRERSSEEYLDVAHWLQGDVKISAGEKLEMESKGFRWSPEKGRWVDLSESEEKDELDFDVPWGVVR